MSELANFPFKNQLHSPTYDGQADENRLFNCVPTCLAAGLEYLTGRVFEPDELKDAIYGQGYQGGTSARAFVTYAARQGVRLYSLNGSGSSLVQVAREQLSQGHPVLITEPDPYGDPTKYLHVVILYKDMPGMLVVMDPFGATAKAASDQTWADRIQATGGQIWIMERIPGAPINVPSGWRDDGTTLTAPNGHRVVKGFRSYILSHTWPPANYPLEEEHNQDPLEHSNPALGSGSQQAFRWTVLEWTPRRNVFEMWTGQELLELRKLIA